MGKKLHGRATTTPAVRKAIQESKETILALAKKYNITPTTVKKWKKRTSVEDQKCGAPSRSKSLNQEQEAAAVAFRKHTKLSIEDCFYALKKKMIPHLTLSSLYRCYKRHGINRIGDENAKKVRRQKKKFKNYPPGYVHVDITQLYTEEGKLYLFVGIDRTTKFCYVSVFKRQTAGEAVKFLRKMEKALPTRIKTILTDNGLQFTRHTGDKQSHVFTKTCNELGIQHRTTKPFHPWTNGQVERMNRTIKEATVKKFYYDNHEVLMKHLQTFIDVYNYAQPLKSLGGISPYEKTCLYLQGAKGNSLINPSCLIPKAYN